MTPDAKKAVKRFGWKPGQVSWTESSRPEAVKMQNCEHGNMNGILSSYEEARAWIGDAVLAKAGPKGYTHGWIKAGSPASDDMERHLDAGTQARVGAHMDQAHRDMAAGKHADAISHLAAARGELHAHSVPALRDSITAGMEEVTGRQSGKIKDEPVPAPAKPDHPAYSSSGSHGPAIRQYNQDVQSGRVGFGSLPGFPGSSSQFANRYPGHAASEASIRDFVSAHRPLTMAVMASLLKTYEEVKAEIDADRVQGILSSASWLASVMEASAEKEGLHPRLG